MKTLINKKPRANALKASRRQFRMLQLISKRNLRRNFFQRKRRGSRRK
jgi:hypothetical protein